MPSSGFLLIDKPAGITSHDVVSRLRRITGVARIGHSGTLDPFATGLLIVGVGRVATRELGKFLKLDKTYRAVMHLGATSDTGDCTGTISNSQFPISNIEQTALEKTLSQFTGDLQQTPPMYSAKKIAGKKLYELARKGITVERAPVPITIFSLSLVDYQAPLAPQRASANFAGLATLDIHCTSGTYIRTLCEDIGAALGVGAYTEALTRTSIGQYHLKDALKLDTITAENWIQLLQSL